MVLMTLFTTLLKYQFVEKLYPATAAGLEYSCYAADKGLVLKVRKTLNLMISIKYHFNIWSEFSFEL